ncbi:MAG: glycerol-3-phosphate acyltransferase [Patescibacteria group bacterium]|nr:glycerol-3-phosphate acyltransferase [Patescibacteria group bacterium]
MNNIIYSILFFVSSYFLGSFPTAYLIVKKYSNKDIREEETKNVGALNVMRVTDKPLLFLITTFIDASKGALPVLIAKYFSYLGYNQILVMTIAGFGVVLGHCFSIYFKIKDGKFSGGKAQASLIGILWVLDFNWLLLPWAAMAIVFILATQSFFFGQFMGNFLLPLIGYSLSPNYFLVCLLMAIPIFIKQWPSVIPALKGEIPKWYYRGIKNIKTKNQNNV